MKRPLSVEDENDDQTDLVSHSSLNAANMATSNSMATLRAHDAVALEITVCIVQLFRKGTFKLTEAVLFQCLTALVSFLPLIKADLAHYHESFDSDLKSLNAKNLSSRNQELVQQLSAQL